VETTNPAANHVLIARDGAVLTLTFNRPEARNAMTWDMYERLHATCENVDVDDTIRVLVLKGAGGKAFVAGTDIAQFAEFKSGKDGLRYERDAERFLGRLARVKKPVIAQIQGFAVGGGFGIAAGADVRIATPDASFGVPIARTLGNCLAMPTYARFIDILGPSRLNELLITARLMPASEALSAGFVHRIVDAQDIEAHVRELAQRIATHAPITMAVTKESVRRIQESRELPDGDDLVIKTYASADFREGVRAFIEKRPARWTGQ
jgi:enoyl-CoA hydratase/carnithine racemase